MMKLLIDTDPGADDCHALTHLLNHGNIIAITSVFGNTTQPQAAHNVCRILEMLGMNHIPVYNGAQCSLKSAEYVVNEGSRHVHGSDGMNDAADVIPLNVGKEPEMSLTASNAIINIVKANPGEVTLVALGPLTNIAIATRLCPELPTLVKSIYVMGSSSKKGNITPWAEFNFHCDPLAAHITLRHFCRSCLVHLVPWETCMDNQISFEKYDSLVEGLENCPAKSLIKATGMTDRMLERKKNGLGYYFADQFISLLLVYPESVIESEYFETMNVVCDEKDEKYGFAEYVKSDGCEKEQYGFIVYKKFDMNYMMKLYRSSMKS